METLKNQKLQEAEEECWNESRQYAELAGKENEHSQKRWYQGQARAWKYAALKIQRLSQHSGDQPEGEEDWFALRWLNDNDPKGEHFPSGTQLRMCQKMVNAAIQSQKQAWLKERRELRECLKDVIDYRMGNGKYNLSGIWVNSDRENVAFDLWMELENKIKTLLNTNSTNTK